MASNDGFKRYFHDRRCDGGVENSSSQNPQDHSVIDQPHLDSITSNSCGKPSQIESSPELNVSVEHPETTLLEPSLTGIVNELEDLELKRDMERSGPSTPTKASLAKAVDAPNVTEKQRIPARSTVQPRTGTTDHVKKYLDEIGSPSSEANWRGRPEFPTSEELLDEPTIWESVTADGIVELHGLIVNGAFPSNEDYLKRQYELFREEAVRPLREAIKVVQERPSVTEAEIPRGCNIGLYDRVHIRAVNLSYSRGPVLEMGFSLCRVGKRPRWEQSPRLCSGSLVALSPIDDSFKTKVIAAVIASRSLQFLTEETTPRIELFFPRPEEMDLDPLKEYLMIEERTGFFEAQRHVMLSLQHMMSEPFPLSNHIVDVEPEIGPPTYVSENPIMNLASVWDPHLIASAEVSECEVNVLHNFPESQKLVFDSSQTEALRQILTKRLAVIQGPPGTGKTFVSVKALRVLIESRNDADPPIIVACQTNHALDQLLRHVHSFEPEFARLGSRTKDKDIVKERTLYELRFGKRPLDARKRALREMVAIERQVDDMLRFFSSETAIFDPKSYQKLGLLSGKQVESLFKAIGSSETAASEPESCLKAWLCGEIIETDSREFLGDLQFNYEEEDQFLPFEQIKEREAEAMITDDAERPLHGYRIQVQQKFKAATHSCLSQRDADRFLQQDDLYKIAKRKRGPLFQYLVEMTKRKLSTLFLKFVRTLNEISRRYVASGWEADVKILKSKKVVGMTTTGLSKYRAMVQALGPRIVMIEEAAEALEATVTPACLPTVEQLILVGDHKQLRPQCQVKDFEDEPYFLNVSLFERLVQNSVEFKVLRQQRRMVPDISRLLQPIYKDALQDHPLVTDHTFRPLVPGMGKNRLHFYQHESAEDRDENMSLRNEYEAEMIVGFYNYLLQNGLQPEQITVLTFYNGQRKFILKRMRAHPAVSTIEADRRNVVTVDSFQGEENDVVILSLTRSNDKDQIGFLSTENRVCVALSRARRGFYVFGNINLLSRRNKLWNDVRTLVADTVDTSPEPKIAEFLPLVCQTHETTNYIADTSDWSAIDGGCTEDCKDDMGCGHKCPLKCHSFPHDRVICKARCKKTLSCGHQCSNLCSSDCRCTICIEQPQDADSARPPPNANSRVYNHIFTPPQQPLTSAPQNIHWSRVRAPDPKASEVLSGPERHENREDTVTPESREGSNTGRQYPTEGSGRGSRSRGRGRGRGRGWGRGRGQESRYLH